MCFHSKGHSIFPVTSCLLSVGRTEFFCMKFSAAKVVEERREWKMTLGSNQSFKGIGFRMEVTQKVPVI